MRGELPHGRDLAVHFEKRHDHILRDIGALLTHAPDLGDVTFQVVSTPRPAVRGRTDRSFNMDRDGFALAAREAIEPASQWCSLFQKIAAKSMWHKADWPRRSFADRAYL
ncbi:Rha family transcriptional regulator [Methylorubrum populi]|uniref:Rha family transcriptional regulator n=1 Tax=Methylorubrum populi TaxID=223967 RepID=UPI003F657488